MSELASESVESTKDGLYFLESVTFLVSFLSLLTDLSRSDNGLRWRIVFFEYRNIVSAMVLSFLPKNIFLRVVLRSLRNPPLWPTSQKMTFRISLKLYTLCTSQILFLYCFLDAPLQPNFCGIVTHESWMDLCTQAIDLVEIWRGSDACNITIKQ